VCSQNLYHFGEKAVRAREKSQLAYLTKRILRAECDIVAVQEVIGGTESEAATTLSRIAHSWEAAGAEKILSYVGTTKDKFIRNGFLVRSSVGRVVTVKSFLDAPVPSLSPLGPVLFFQRAPMALVLETPATKPNRRFWIMNMHQKSRSRGFEDGSGTHYELLRLEMAKGVRDIIEQEEQKEPDGTIFVITGDRNSDENDASVDVLLGRRELADFSKSGGCKIRKDDRAQCKNESPRPAEFVGLFQHRREKFPGEYPGGTYSFKNRQTALDEFAIREKNLPLVTRPNGKLSIGLEGQFFRGSDHKLIWAEFHF